MHVTRAILWVRAVFALALVCMTTAAAVGQTEADAAHAMADEVPLEVCLACHGPAGTLRELTQDWVAPSGIPVNPHISFDVTQPVNPHASGEGMLLCTQCHVAHTIPLEEPVPTAGIDSCIDCHHTGTFRTCTECH